MNTVVTAFLLHDYKSVVKILLHAYKSAVTFFAVYYSFYYNAKKPCFIGVTEIIR